MRSYPTHNPLFVKTARKARLRFNVPLTVIKVNAIGIVVTEDDDSIRYWLRSGATQPLRELGQVRVNL
jgi:hypothetical protein